METLLSQIRNELSTIPNPVLGPSNQGTHEPATENSLKNDSARRAQAAESCPQVIPFFGLVRKIYNVFSSTPQRWEILKKHIGRSLHSMSETRWSARVESVTCRPMAKHLPAFAVDDVLELNLTAETRSDLNGIKTYLNTFECVVMASSWLKVLAAIDVRNKVLQARDATLDVEVEHIKSLIDDLKHLLLYTNSI